MSQLYDVVIAGAEVVTSAGMRLVDVAISDGRIAALAAPGESGAGARETIAAAGMVVLPGAIDAHTHFIQDDTDRVPPDPDEFEGFWHGGRAAAAGGVTCVVEMPHARPPTIDVASFRRKRELAERDALVDFALWGGVVGAQDRGTLTDLVAEGAAALKAYMCGSDPLLPGIDDARLLDAMAELASGPAMIGLHAENDALLSAGLARMHAQDRRDPLAHAESRPAIVEAEAVARAIVLARHAGAHVHIVHLSTAAAVEHVRRAKLDGARVTAEACPHHLLLTVDDLQRLGGYARCAPPLREATDTQALWDGLADGTLDSIASDHCAFTFESKARGGEDIWSAPNGLPGVETLLPALVSEGPRHGLGWERIAQITASAPARLWGLAPAKGSIAVGCDADLAIVDPAGHWEVSGDDLHGAHHWTPFAGRRFEGRIVRTLRRGETVYDVAASEQVKGARGSGAFVAAHRR